MKKYLFIIVPLLMLVALCSFKIKKIPYLKAYFHHTLQIQEPSDICLTTADPSHYYIVGNRGRVAETDSNGRVIRTYDNDGSDYEACCVKDNMLYVIDESLRRVDVLSESDFKVKRTFYLNYMGARNKAFEGLTYIPSEKKWIAVIEKPAVIVEMDEQFHVTNQVQLKQFFEFSSVTYHDNYLWMLGDEQHLLMKVDPSDYSIIQKWNLPVINPEGVCFDAKGNLLIVSDDMATLFKFKFN